MKLLILLYPIIYDMRLQILKISVYFLTTSDRLRNTLKVLIIFWNKKRICVSIWNKNQKIDIQITY